MPPLGRGFLGLLVGFLLVGWATSLSPVQSVDRFVQQQVSQRKGSGVARALNALMRLADPHPLLLGAVVVAVILVGRERAPMLGFVTCAMVGTFGLELCCKLWFPQVRTSQFLGQPLSNYPSGTAMRAMVLAGVLLGLWGPVWHRGWPRVWLWSAVAGWPLIIATAVVLWRHTLSEVVGGLLLGAAWVGVCLRRLF
jgi:undecaprenyl-diphosphatase